MSHRMAQSHHILPRLGLKAGNHLPESLPEQLVNVAYWDDPEIHAMVWIAPPSVEHPGSRGHRVMVRCPGCGSEMSLGRFNQHYGTPKCQKGAAHLVRQK